MTNVVYVDAATTTTISAKNDVIVTVLSSSGAVHLSGWKGDYSVSRALLPLWYSATVLSNNRSAAGSRMLVPYNRLRNLAV